MNYHPHRSRLVQAQKLHDLIRERISLQFPNGGLRHQKTVRLVLPQVYLDTDYINKRQYFGFWIYTLDYNCRKIDRPNGYETGMTGFRYLMCKTERHLDLLRQCLVIQS